MIVLYNLFADADYILRPREGVLKTHPKGSVYRNNAGFEADYIKVASADKTASMKMLMSFNKTIEQRLINGYEFKK